MILLHRIRRLERQPVFAPAPTCLECLRWAATQPQDTPLVVTFDDDPGPDRCPGCGRLRILRITFDERN